MTVALNVTIPMCHCSVMSYCLTRRLAKGAMGDHYMLDLLISIRGDRQKHTFLAPDLMNMIQQLMAVIGFDLYTAQRIVSCAPSQTN